MVWGYESKRSAFFEELDRRSARFGVEGDGPAVFREETSFREAAEDFLAGLRNSLPPRPAGSSDLEQSGGVGEGPF